MAPSNSPTTGFPSLTAGAFTLRDGRFSAARTPSGIRLAVLNGGVSSDFGALAFSGTAEPNGAFTLFTRSTGTLNVGPYAFSYSAPIKLTATQWEGAGTVAFGRFGLSGTLKVPGSGVPAFTGTATGTSSPKAIGKTICGAPGHPYAWVLWTVTGTYEPANKTLKNTVAGSLTVEYETAPGKYAKKNFEYGPLNIGTSGALTVDPGEAFNGISGFGFTLP